MFKNVKGLFSSNNSIRESSKQSDLPSAGMGNTGLLSWWMAEFSEGDRKHILKKYQPMVMGLGSDQLIAIDRIIGTDGRSRIKLTALATWFMSPKDDLPLAIRLLQKGVDIGEEKQGTILDQHFTLHNMINVYYRNRANDVESLELAIGACEKQIALAPNAAEDFKRLERMDRLPVHTGFKQLVIIREREKSYDEAIRLCMEALRQGWSGDWEKRIARCDRRRGRAR